MALVLPSAGKILALAKLLYSAGAEALQLRLYTNAYDPVAASVTGDFTEAVFTGYTAGGKTLAATQTGATWAVPTIVGTQAQSIFAVAQTWTASATGSDASIAGWFLVGVTSGTCYAAQRFAANKPLTGLTGAGDQISITPTLALTAI